MAWVERRLGFDRREDPTLPDDSWEDVRRDTFLLRPDVPRPLSVDPAVWRRPDGTLDDRLSPELRPGPGVAIGITVWGGPGQPDLGLPLGDPPDPSWILLGWDLGGLQGPSLLTNCGFLDADHAAAWRRAWAEAIGPHHLIPDLPTAFAAQTLLARRAPDHAPFPVFGLYRVDG